MSTITTIKARIEGRFPRIDSYVSSELSTYLYDWVADLCSEFPFWFLKIFPGNLFPANFPTTEAALAGFTHYKTDWLDRGWLHAIEDKAKYFLCAPAAVGLHDQNETNTLRCKAQKMYFVQQFDVNGNFQQDLPIHCGAETQARSNWGRTGTPRQVFFESGLDENSAEVSWIRLHPTPDKDYLYAVSFALTAPLNYDNPVTNRFFQEYPEAVVAAGMLFCSEYFNEARDVEYWTMKLYGNPAAGFQSRKIGLIEKIKRDSRKKEEQADYSIPVYRGARRAVGRSGRPGYIWKGVYEGRDGFS